MERDVALPPSTRNRDQSGRYTSYAKLEEEAVSLTESSTMSADSNGMSASSTDADDVTASLLASNVRSINGFTLDYLYHFAQVVANVVQRLPSSRSIRKLVAQVNAEIREYNNLCRSLDAAGVHVVRLPVIAAHRTHAPDAMITSTDGINDAFRMLYEYGLTVCAARHMVEDHVVAEVRVVGGV